MKKVHNWCDEYKVTVPVGRSGVWRIDRFKISRSEAASFNLKLAFNDSGHRRTLPGKYTRLLRDGDCDPWMSDCPAEISDHLSFIARASGTVLVNGLGLGVVLQALLRKPDVKHLTVVELEQDVINLVAPHYYKMFGTSRLNIVCDDAFKFSPPRGVVYDAVWHDIWRDISIDNYDGIKRLNRRFGRWCKYQAYWARYEIQRERRAARENQFMLDLYNNKLSESVKSLGREFEGIKI